MSVIESGFVKIRVAIYNQKLPKKRYFEKVILIDCHESANADSRNDGKSCHT
ncbi:hypothetical protein [Helicobacter sp. T3_23-1056]